MTSPDFIEARYASSAFIFKPLLVNALWRQHCTSSQICVSLQSDTRKNTEQALLQAFNMPKLNTLSQFPLILSHEYKTDSNGTKLRLEYSQRIFSTQISATCQEVRKKKNIDGIYFTNPILRMILWFENHGYRALKLCTLRVWICLYSSHRADLKVTFCDK